MPIDPAVIPVLAQALKDYPANGQLDMTNDAHVALRSYGLVVQQTTQKRCQACGHERPDHYWYSITPAGRLFMATQGIDR